MKKYIAPFLLIVLAISSYAQAPSTYVISFENVVHHEAHINATFTNLKNSTVEITMSRSSPGRYALHEFVKNVYNLKVTDSKDNPLEAVRQDPYSWIISGHDGVIKLSYILFANRGDGTYSQVDETHAHLNMPATFMFVPELANEKYQVTFKVREDLDWKVATQLRQVKENTYAANNLQYFMDSPTEISNHSIRSFDVDGQTINFVLHHQGTDAELDQYFEDVKPIVLQQKAVFGELPKFDYKNYYFLACYMPNVSGDGMEHRNSTILTSTRSLANGGLKGNLGTVSHEFFHSWNVERIRPTDLEPFNFLQANMSEGLWFAEGFTSYYTGLILCRAGLRSQEDYVKSLVGVFNYVWNSAGRNYFSPIGMSQQAPFVDAAKAMDPVNRDNTYISYYSYGSALGLALDLALREKGLNLDDYMKMVWFNHGKNEKPYTVSDLQQVLSDYAGKDFADGFFNSYIHKSEMPDMKRLFENMGIALTQDKDKPWFGGAVNKGKIVRNTTVGSPAYKAGLENGDTIIKFGEYVVSSDSDFTTLLNNFKPGDDVVVAFERFGETKITRVTIGSSPTYLIDIFEGVGIDPNEEQKAARAKWLNTKE